MNINENYYNELLIKAGLIASFIYLLTFIIGLFYFKFFNKALRIVLYYLLARLILEFLSKLFIWSASKPKHYDLFWKPILENFQIYDTNFFNGFYYLINFIFIGIFYGQILAKPINTLYLKYVTIALSTFQIINYFFIDGFRNYGTIGVILSDTFLIILPCIYLYQMSTNPPRISVKDNSYFWLSLGLFIPHVLQLLITFTASDLHKTNFVLFCKTHIFRTIILIFSQILFLYALTKAKYLKYM